MTPFSEAELRERLAKEFERINWPNLAQCARTVGVRHFSDKWAIDIALAAMSAIAREAHNRAVEECAKTCDGLGDAEFSERAKKQNIGIATISQRHYIKCSDAIRALKLPEDQT